MSPSELVDCCANARRAYEEHGWTSEPGFVLSVPRIASGERMRVMPGVMGYVMSWNGKETNVRVLCRDVEKALARLEAGR